MHKCHSGQCSCWQKWWHQIQTTCIVNKWIPSDKHKQWVIQRERASVDCTSRERSNNMDQRASVRRTSSSKSRFENGCGMFLSNRTGQRWSGDTDKRPHEQYRRAHNQYTGQTTTADTTDATGPATGRGGRRTHANGHAKGSSRHQIVVNVRC